MVLNDDLGNTMPQDPIARFEDFFRMVEQPVGTFVYLNKIKYMLAEGTRSLYVDHEHLTRYDIQLARDLHENPGEYLKKANQALVNILHTQSGGVIKLTDEYFVRFFNIDKHYKLKLRKIRAEHMEKLYSFSGSLIRATNVRPQITIANFECKLCGAVHNIEQIDDNITYPSICNVGGCRNSKQSAFRLIGKNSEFIDWQQIRVQEMPEELSSGNVPRFLDCLLLHDIVDSCRPGDRVTLVGVIKVIPVNKGRGQQKRVFQLLMHVNNIYSEEEDDESLEITEEDEKKIKELAKDPFIHTKITRSVAPDIYGYEEIKKATALVLFGGVHKTKRTGHKIRGDIHIMVMGDPGTGKSQIIKSASRLAPRAIYTSGKGSTAAGLTAAVLRDEITGSMVLEAGALVLADGGVAAIDEFDKMRVIDRVAIHEIMEQQSYHYNTEILTTDGKRLRIGEFVDEIFQKNQKKIIQGIDCEIIPYEKLQVYSTDFTKIYKTRINRISRHKAPDKFYKFKFSNGRDVIVTPEHPLFIYDGGKLRTVQADKCQIDSFIPAPKYLPNSAESIPLRELTEIPHYNAKEIYFPSDLSPELARVLGYFITEGHSFLGSTIEIGFSNMNEEILDDFALLMKKLFGMSHSTNVNAVGVTTLRYLSVELYKWMKLNFPEVIAKSRKKRIPVKILGASKDINKEFLKSAFLGDGSVETTSICFRTSSEGLSRDYQDSLLKLGIQSRIVKDKHNDSFKVYIRGQSLSLFLEEIVEKIDKRYEKITDLIKPGQKIIRHHDIFPTSIAKKIIELKKDLAITYDGFFHRHLKEKHGITRDILERNISELRNKFSYIIKNLNPNSDIIDIRNKFGYSQAQIASIASITRGNVDYYENGGYSTSKHDDLKLQISDSFKKKMDDIGVRIQELENLRDSDILWDRITDIEIIKNVGEDKTPWVYDITVEPNHTFIGQGVVLHNTVSIAKAGIVATLNARTSIIAAANPKAGRYDPDESPSENINLPPSILSRFDLLFIIKDKPNDEEDSKVADHILKLHMPESSLGAEAKDIEPPIDLGILKKYIKYATTECTPELTPEAADKIKEFYLKMRSPAQGSAEAPIPIVARALEGLIRMSEAHAKMAIRNEITVEDVEEVIKLMTYSMQQVGWDADRQVFDVDKIHLGRPKSKFEKAKRLLKIISHLQEDAKNDPVMLNDIIQAAIFEDIDEDEVRSLLELLKENSDI
ncbi:MAG: LAGLIDADG family homing endonuclease, partial [Candidatus Hodarchaeota archaeon]